MNIPTLFRSSVCKCGCELKESDMKEIGVDILESIFFMRFKCPSCDLDGKIRFSKFKKTVTELCKEIVSEGKEEEFDLAEEMFELYKERIACLHIPDWNDESYSECLSSIENINKG